ncbi:putative cathepsin B4 cysteine protease [Monocercomonoides exilis]|uniref:Cathepsin B4 cysteine protease n=1 Tax=Monocercomonoides sp. PA TaxID=302782 RepID=B1NHV7_9EUKA|nr:cathepsin B4 cysteine protease [Monocercomonoides sp. PA]KAH7814882.1 putative cathepsin B4 cysteine protease [Monocercomonoides exilis]|eukprot:MONOS_16628.1-p1 / transcript=MONOS_16628.1 / gene=MONOS_16628 / organism=Monocercomonoides_exilis_PA203 / gene_product=cathepsin B4 cysteine protease / transcript_product=cathepsin B4 cysteine protease / location=Mono_scaffold01947:1552-2397(-) / protein_length=281 / sequence_SO=supercontig / SO=protein_coding / is_pseudo=false
MFFFLFASVVAESIVETINNDPTSTWVAAEYPRSVINVAKFRAMLGAELGPHMPYVQPLSLSEPTEFDAREQWPGKILPVRDQASCGSCWAHSVAEAMGDAQNIAGCPRGAMSVQDLVSCDKTDSACNGGDMKKAQEYLVKTGITTEACVKYVSGSGRVPACPSKCDNGSQIIRYKLQSWKSVEPSEIMQALMEYGPLSCGFMVYSDFMNYRSGVYQHKSGYFEGGHAVLLCGWGVENGLPYWLVQNSWGPAWGEKGFFKILRGSNHCEIESYVTLGVPKC